MRAETHQRLFGDESKLPPLPDGWKERAIRLIEKAESESPEAEELVISQVERMMRVVRFQLRKRNK